ncbi:hypothetical protein JTE90_015622 [Oedothorax gibbosus]|uniref:Uncharacterized protein n=1 Tax=Oedothorax gibbosus TaxID=931172 RepID=A0AAV6UTU7_9ARAC|nr:hypothetical protein JTE90_015622 [Oedothorax gibbosus]
MDRLLTSLYGRLLIPPLYRPLLLFYRRPQPLLSAPPASLYRPPPHPPLYRPPPHPPLYRPPPHPPSIGRLLFPLYRPPPHPPSIGRLLTLPLSAASSTSPYRPPTSLIAASYHLYGAPHSPPSHSLSEHLPPLRPLLTLPYRPPPQPPLSAASTTSLDRPPPQPPSISPNALKCSRNGDLEESLTSEQLRELLSCSRITDRCPRTVPGVRLSSQQNRNDNWNYNNPEVIRSASSSGGSSNGWNKRSVVRSTLPEVSSSEWGPKVVWGTGDLSDSACSTGGSSSSGSSLPPLSRENNMEMTQGAPNCHLCRSPFPMASAKYCCECGARRRGVGCINQTG